MKGSRAVGTTWRCVDLESELFFQECVIRGIDCRPSGSIELQYEYDSIHYDKANRFIPNVTHVLIKR